MSREDVRTNLASWEADSEDYQARNRAQLNRWDRLAWGTWDIPEDDIHALGEGTDTIGVVTVRIAPPDVAGKRGTGEYSAESRGTNIIAASIEAYIVALNAMLGEEHWEGAPEEAAVTGKRARAKAPVTAGTARERRAELDEESGEIDTTDWFNRQG